MLPKASGLILIAVLFAGSALADSAFAIKSAFAYDAEDPANCNGADWDIKEPLAVAKVIQARVNFIKSQYDDDFTAAACPAAGEACRKNSYLVAGDLVLAGRTRGDFTCVTYQSPQAKKHIWTEGWFPSAALVPVPAMPSVQTGDWIGAWYHPFGGIKIRKRDDNKLAVEGELVVPTAHDFHTGEIQAQVIPEKDMIAFADDGSIPFKNWDEGECRVRMQRLGPWLLVEDNGACGGASVTFTGFYYHKK